MRHRVYGKKLGRNKNERTALFKNLVGALILHGSIETTESKAKAIKGLVDRIISQAKSKDTQRLVSQFLTQKNIQEKLFKEVIPFLKGRNSGYTSVIRVGQRLGDNAMKVRMSLIMDEKKPVIASVAKQSSSEKTQSKIATKPAASRNDEKPKAKKPAKKASKNVH